MKLLSIFLPAALANNAAEESDFSILHCNNPTTMRAEMKVKVQARFLTRNGGLEATWADGFTEESTGVFTKIIEANDLVLSEKDGDTDSEFKTLNLDDKSGNSKENYHFKIITWAIK